VVLDLQLAAELLLLFSGKIEPSVLGVRSVSGDNLSHESPAFLGHECGWDFTAA
jgi:hypothetical protein